MNRTTTQIHGSTDVTVALLVSAIGRAPIVGDAGTARTAQLPAGSRRRNSARRNG